MKYDVMRCTGFWLPDNPMTETQVMFRDVLIAKGDWNGDEDEDDELIFFYMDGKELNVGDILAEGFVIINIEREEQ